jgi:hypothetical protein
MNRRIFGLEDRPGRHEQAHRLAGGRDIEAAERSAFLLQRHQLGLAQQRQLGQRLAIGDRARIDAGEMFLPARRFQRMRDLIGQTGKQVALARGGVAGFESVEMLGGHRTARLTPATACAACSA